MICRNLTVPTEHVRFAEALRRGLGAQRGLFFPDEIPTVDASALLACSPHERATRTLHAWLHEELDEQTLAGIVERAFCFSTPLVPIGDGTHVLELFHGPTLAFKDYGARFMAQCLSHFWRDERITILTATSGDTGAAVAHAFHGLPNIEVVVLYPKGRISTLQERLFCTLGGNIHTVAVEAPFDACQTLVKQAFDDAALVKQLGLNSANSINIARLLAQITYYTDALAALSSGERERSVFAVPSGNFGNLTAGLFAKAMGFPIGRFIAATNANDTVPRYLASGTWAPRETVPTLSNAMDVSAPSNWPRVEAIAKRMGWPLASLSGFCLDDPATRAAMQTLAAAGYTSEPHAAIAHAALEAKQQDGEIGVFLGTAHPAKFKESVDATLGGNLPIPAAIAERLHEPLLSETIADDPDALRAILDRLA